MQLLLEVGIADLLQDVRIPRLVDLECLPAVRADDFVHFHASPIPREFHFRGAPRRPRFSASVPEFPAPFLPLPNKHGLSPISRRRAGIFEVAWRSRVQRAVSAGKTAEFQKLGKMEMARIPHVVHGSIESDPSDVAGDGECKFWLGPVRLARSRNVSPVELSRIENTVFEQEQFFMEKWHEFFKE